LRRLLCLVLALLPLACQTPVPFDPGADCPKEAYCGQCASRGGCSWCGDPNDGSRGQCVAVGRAECSAPSAWAKTPDRCAPPPLASAAPTAAAASSTDDQKSAAIRVALTRAFPSSTVTDDLVAKVSDFLKAFPKGPPGSPPRAPAMDRAPLARPVRARDHSLYLGNATHHRVRSAPPASRPMQSEFMLALPMVRVSLPDTLTAENATIDTEIGDVDLRNDHLLGSIALIDSKYGGAAYLGARPERVDLITPARAAHGRFGAIAVYLGYRHKTDRGPWFYLLEAGTATGDAKMIYFSPDMKPITSVTSYYLPTPFVTMRNTYSGGVTMAPPPNEDEPLKLLVESRSPGEKDPYITVSVEYKRVTAFDLPMPVEITWRRRCTGSSSPTTSTRPRRRRAEPPSPRRPPAPPSRRHRARRRTDTFARRLGPGSDAIPERHQVIRRNNSLEPAPR
jgi:hypothetical protein